MPVNDDQTESVTNNLDELCRHAASLIGAASCPLKLLRITVGDMSIEVEWPDTPINDHNGFPNDQKGGMIAGVGNSSPPARSDHDNSFTVDAPLVGTLYRAPSPDARPFVEVGDNVEEGQQVAIIEAMKLMNAVTADRSGRVVEVLVADATPVEYGEPLLLLAPPEPP